MNALPQDNVEHVKQQLGVLPVDQRSALLCWSVFPSSFTEAAAKQVRGYAYWAVPDTCALCWETVHRPPNTSNHQGMFPQWMSMQVAGITATAQLRDMMKLLQQRALVIKAQDRPNAYRLDASIRIACR